LQSEKVDWIDLARCSAPGEPVVGLRVGAIPMQDDVAYSQALEKIYAATLSESS